MQRFFSAASQNRDVPSTVLCYGPGSAAHRHSASKTRVNALMAKSYALRCVRGTRPVSPSPGMPPRLVPVLPCGVDDAAVGFEEFVGDLEDRQHQAALRTPGDVAAALLAPDEFAGLA